MKIETLDGRIETSYDYVVFWWGGTDMPHFSAVLLVLFSALAQAQINAAPAVPPATVKAKADVKNMKDGSVVEFQLMNFSGDDGYPEYKAVAGPGPIAGADMTLRCNDNGYDTVNGKTYTWGYHEIFVFDDTARDVKRKEPRAKVASEKGWSFKFRNLAECEKAGPSILSGAVCTMKVQLSKARGAAKLISSDCTETMSAAAPVAKPSSKKTKP